MKKHLLSLLCLLSIALPGLADTYAIVADGATYDGAGQAKTFNSVPAGYDGVATLSTSSYNANSKHFRTNANTNLVITPASGVTITKVTFTNVNSNTPTVTLSSTIGTLSESNKTYTWTGTTTEVITIKTNAQLRFKFVEIETLGFSFPTTCAAPVFNVEHNAKVPVGSVVRATCDTPNSTVTITGLKEPVVGEAKAGFAEFTITEDLLNTIVGLHATANVDGENEVITSDTNSIDIEVVEAPKVVGDELTPTSFGLSGTGYTLYNYTSESTEVSYSAKAGLENNAFHINTTNTKNGKNSGLTSVNNPKSLVIESIIVTVDGGTPIMNMSNTPGIVEGTPESSPANISITAPADAETITGTVSGSDYTYTPTKDFTYFTLTSDGNSHFSKVLVNYKKPEVPEPEAIVVTPALNGANEITVTAGSTVTFSSNNAAQLSVSINAGEATLEANPFVLTPTEDCTVEIIPVDSEGNLYENLKLEACVFVDATVEPVMAKSTYTFDFTKSDLLDNEKEFNNPDEMIYLKSDGAGIFEVMLTDNWKPTSKFEYIANEGWKFCTDPDNGSDYAIALYNNIEPAYNITSVKFNFADNSSIEFSENGTALTNNQWTGHSESLNIDVTALDEFILNSIDVTFEHEAVKKPELVRNSVAKCWSLKHEFEDHAVFFKITNAGEDVTADRMISGTAPAAPARSMNIDANYNGYTAYTAGSEFNLLDGDTLSTYSQHPHGMVSEIYNRTYDDIMTGVESIDADAEGEVMYFNLQGVRVAEPTEGVFIRIANGKATKVVR